MGFIPTRVRVPSLAIAVLAPALLIPSPGCASGERLSPNEGPPSGNDPKEGGQTRREEDLSRSCIECHRGASDPHGKQLVTCVGCHGGDGTECTKERAHPRPRYPAEWPTAANPERPYTLTLAESEEWVRFVNPGDLRVAAMTCGGVTGCHVNEEEGVNVPRNVMKSLMTTSQHFWGTATYSNGIVSNKRSLFGESYGLDGRPRKINNLVSDGDTLRLPTEAELAQHGWSKIAVPLPHWEVTQPGNVFRVFEQGSRLGGVGLGSNGLASAIPGLPDKFEDPGRPNNRLSDRGLGTLNRVDLPTLNLHKTRLNDPQLSFFGTNDQPGDYRSSGCTACHMVYANDRDPTHSGPWARYGNEGYGNASTSLWPHADPNKSGATIDGDVVQDPTIPVRESGHPILHRFTTAIPSSQCMVCHMHQPNAFLNTYYGYQMWSYETDGQAMWPEEQQQKTNDELFSIFDGNPEGAALRGKWGDSKLFLQRVAEDVNPKLEHTQFADYHGHGWIFRAVLKTDKKGNLLDANDVEIKPYDRLDKFLGVIPPLAGRTDSKGHVLDPEGNVISPKPGIPVHLKDIHAEKGMHCVDCHFRQDVHGDGHLYAEYQAAIQIQCQDCHGTTEEYATLRPSGPAAKDNDRLDGTKQLTPWGKQRIERSSDTFTQRSMLYPDLEWEVHQVKDSVNRDDRRHYKDGTPHYNPRAEYAKLQVSQSGTWAHAPGKMDCAACHTSWVTSCFGCHLPQEANWKSDMHHFERKQLRNLASYNPQVARDDAFMLGISPDVKGNRVAVVRSSSAVMISSKDAQRRIIYKQQPTVAANGMSGQCFNTHFAHTVRKTETKRCSDCLLGERNDNNAWLAQTYLLGTNYVNFFGMHAYVGEGEDGLDAVQWTEWTEPQAVIGSNLHRMAYPAEYRAHEEGGRVLQNAEHHDGTDIRSLELRGEYLYTASGADGFRVYDVANVANKDFSEKIVTSPVSPLGQDTHVPTRYATAVALPTNMPISMDREYRPENREQNYPYRGRDQNLHESYRYAYITDRFEGLILVDVDCLTDGNPKNNFLSRALTFNPDGLLDGAENLAVAGTTLYVCCRGGIVAIDIADPLAPRKIAQVSAPQVNAPTAIAVQFRYAFVTDGDGLKVLDVTWPAKLHVVEGATLPIADARSVYVARTYAYVAGGSQGLWIVNVENPEQPTKPDRPFTAGGAIGDTNQVRIGMVNDSLYGLVADGKNGLHVLQLVTPEDGGRSAYGFAPEPRPKLIATYRTKGQALAIAKGLDRDRAVDESGNQVAIFGRIGGRPFNLDKMRQLSAVRKPDKPPEGWDPPHKTSSD